MEISIEEAERLILARLQTNAKDRQRILKDLAFLYSDTHRYEQSLDCLRQMVALETVLENKVGCILEMGCTAESKQDFSAAVRFYREALALKPIARNIGWYFIHNNLGFSLNKLGQFNEGEKYCRTAIELIPLRTNGHKNLGIALAGQGHLRDAAKSFVAATKANAGDGRSYELLKDLLLQHPELMVEFQDDFNWCREAVMKPITEAIKLDKK